MSYYTTCDWCGKRIEREDDQAQMPVTIYHRKGRSTLDAKWAEETKQTRHFHAAPKQDVDHTGTNRMGLAPGEDVDSCFARAIAAITGTELRDPGMGMEWRLVPVDAPAQDGTVPATPKTSAIPPAAPPSDTQRSGAPQQSPKSRDRKHEEWQEHARRCRVWRGTPWEEKEAYVLDALGEARLTAAELAAKLNARFGWPTDWRVTAQRWVEAVEASPLAIPPIDSETVRPAVMRLLARGEVDRVNAPHGNRPAVWHFFRVAPVATSAGERRGAQHVRRDVG